MSNFMFICHHNFRLLFETVSLRFQVERFDKISSIFNQKPPTQNDLSKILKIIRGQFSYTLFLNVHKKNNILHICA